MDNSRGEGGVGGGAWAGEGRDKILTVTKTFYYLIIYCISAFSL